MEIAPRWRLPLLALGFVSLAFGIAGGLARLTPSLAVPGQAIAWHGALMVAAFFGTVISLERAVALGRPWVYVAPLAAGVGGALVVAGLMEAGLISMLVASGVFCAASLLVAARHPSLETVTLLGGALAWLAGNLFFLLGGGTAWWMVFFTLTIGAERLELSRYLNRPAWVRRAFGLLAALLALSPFFLPAAGIMLVAFALWLLAFDLARITIRQTRLPRYVAACLLAGYVWLAVGGAILAAAAWPDAALHAIFVGFVFSMVFGHAPVILPAVLRVRFPYHPVLYLPLALLHASLAVRVFVSTTLGAWGNAAAVALFIITSAALVLAFDPAQDAGKARR